MRLPVPGEHNVLNALAALAPPRPRAATGEAAAGARRASGPPAAASSRGASATARASSTTTRIIRPRSRRRCGRRARSTPRRLVAVFQPHLYSRTLHLHREFGRALALADEVVVLDVYAARERPEGDSPGVTGKLVADAAADRAGGRPVWWLPTIDEAAPCLRRRLGEGDLLVTLGAGDVDRSAAALAGEAGVSRGDAAAARGRRARLPARAPDDDPHRRRRPSTSRAPARWNGWSACCAGPRRQGST